MGHVGPRDHDLTGSRLDRRVANREGGLAFLHDEDFLVGMCVQGGAATGRCFDQEEGDADRAEAVALEDEADPAGAEFVCGEFVCGDRSAS